MACPAGGLLERLAEEEGSGKWGAEGQVSKGSPVLPWVGWLQTFLQGKKQNSESLSHSSQSHH